MERSWETVATIMTQLRKLKNAAKLRTLTFLCPVRPNVTRWSGISNMLPLYFRIEEHVRKIEELELSMPLVRGPILAIWFPVWVISIRFKVIL